MAYMRRYTVLRRYAPVHEDLHKSATMVTRQAPDAV